LRFNAPLGDARAVELAERALEVRPTVVVDFGCGRGEFLLAVIAAGEGVRGVGVDVDTEALDAARAAFAARGLGEQATFVAADARTYTGDADVAISIGASHAFDGLAAMLASLPGSRAIVGDAFWQSTPDDWCLETFGDLPTGIEAMQAVASAAGWRVTDVDVSTLAEWDTFEETWRRGVSAGLAAERKAEYEERYRGVLGFAWLVLDRRPKSS
jgi:SAM-dependent methyltransferase